MAGARAVKHDAAPYQFIERGGKAYAFGASGANVLHEPRGCQYSGIL